MAHELTGDELLAKLVKMYDDALTASTDNDTLCMRDRDFYDGNQWTAKELATLNERGQPVVWANRIKPKVDAFIGIERSMRTTPKTYPRNPQFDEEAAGAATDALRYVAADNDFDHIRADVVENIAIEGRGGAEVVVEVVNGEPAVIIRRLPWDRFFVDPYSRARDCSDARYCGTIRWADVEELKDEYPDKANLIDDQHTLQSSSSTKDSDRPLAWWDMSRQRVMVVEIWWKEGQGVKRAVLIKNEFLETPQPSPYKNAKREQVWPYIFATAFIDREGNPYGTVRNLIPLQQEVNKRRSKLLHLLNVKTVVMEQGASDDVKSVRDELARPDGVVEIKPGFRFDVNSNLDLGNVHFTLLQESKAEIDAVGLNAALTGKQTGAPSGKALLMRQQGGSLELGRLFDERERWSRDVFRRCWELIQQFWTAEKWVRVTDDENNIKFTGLNIPVSLGEIFKNNMAGKPIPSELLMDAQFAPIVQQYVHMRASGDEQGVAMLLSSPLAQMRATLKNNVGELDVDIIVQEEPAVTDTRTETFTALSEMAKSGFFDGIEAEGRAMLIEVAPLPPKVRDKLLQAMKGNTPEARQAKAQQQELMQKEMALKMENGALQNRKLAAEASHTEVETVQKKAEIAKTLGESELAAAVTGVIGNNGPPPESGETQPYGVM